MLGYVPEGEGIVEDGRKMRNKAGKNGSWLPLVQVEIERISVTKLKCVFISYQRLLSEPHYHKSENSPGGGGTAYIRTLRRRCYRSGC